MDHGHWTSSAHFHEHCSTRLRKNLGFTPSKPDADFWIKQAGDHCKCIAMHIDDATICLKDLMFIIEELKRSAFSRRVLENQSVTLAGTLNSLMMHGGKMASQLLSLHKHAAKMSCRSLRKCLTWRHTPLRHP